jgi:hypothetical protein
MHKLTQSYVHGASSTPLIGDTMDEPDTCNALASIHDCVCVNAHERIGHDP